MNISEVYLLTAFVCSACDGEIAPSEVALVKKWCESSSLFENIDVEAKLNEYVDEINKQGKGFISRYFEMLKGNHYTDDEQLQIVRIAIEMIEADGQILYQEVKFFKKLRSFLSIPDEAILHALPDKEDYLLPDINVAPYAFGDDIRFENISLTAIES